MEEKVIKNLALKEIDAFSRRYKDLKKDIASQAKIVAFMLGEDHPTLENVLRVEISPKHGKTFVTSDGTRIGGFLSYDMGTKHIQVDELSNMSNEIVDYYDFDCIDTDIQISILKEIVENYM